MQANKNEYVSMPMLPLRGLSIFPGMMLTFDVERSASVAAVNAAVRGGRVIFLAAQKDVSVDVPEGKFFFLGDNRMHSNDSHTLGGTYLGTITDIVGIAFVRYTGWTDISFL